MTQERGNSFYLSNFIDLPVHFPSLVAVNKEEEFAQSNAFYAKAPHPPSPQTLHKLAQKNFFFHKQNSLKS